MAHRFTRPRLGLLTTCGVAALAGAPATAQISTPAPQTATQAAQAEEAAPPAETAPENDVGPSAGEAQGGSDIVVTGSRVKRDGYAAPTPETVLSSEAIDARAPANLASFVNELPALASSFTPRTATIVVATGSAGSNFLNLRGLGPARTLVLLDGRRVVGANVSGFVDVNTLPTGLVSRVDVVTGGASAAYGSDAVAGVNNFVLDTKFVGLKVNAQTGITTYGDNFNRRVDLTAGVKFADDRGRLLLSGTYAKSDGITTVTGRPWYNSQKIIPNPAFAAGNGQPQFVVAENVNLSNATRGGLITSGVLRGTQFLQGGQAAPFVFGQLAGSQYMIGGTDNDLVDEYSLEVPLEQVNTFARASFDLSQAARVYVEGTYSKSIADSVSFYNFNLGNLTLRSDNAFLAPQLAAQLAAAGQTSFGYGLNPQDIGRINPHNVRELYRAVLGIDGDIGGGWSYAVYGQYGRTDIAIDARNTEIPSRFRNAIDAVRNGAGQIVCRINQTAVTDPGCVPYNPFGIGVNSAAAVAYVSGSSSLRQRLEQTVVSGSVQGEPISTWAGPVSIVVGAEYRKEETSGRNDPISAQRLFLAGNYQPTIGSYDVKEVFGETVVPLAKDVRFLRTLELNAAARHTDYSSSGPVTTWKVGGNWEPFAGLRLRGTLSRDIRAANLAELFQAGQILIGQNATGRGPTITGNFTGFVNTVVGNRALQPEIANSYTIGAVVQPTFVPGLSISIDYYRIKLRDTIVTPSAQQVVDYCNGGNAAYCADVTFTNGVISNVISQPRNLAQERERGLDIDVTYSRPVDALNGRITLHSVATHYIEHVISDGLTTIDYAGVNGTVATNTANVPSWRLTNSVAYDGDAFGAIATARSVSGGIFDPTLSAATLARYYIPGATYFDLGLTAKIAAGRRGAELFFNVDNVFNKDPVIAAPFSQPFLYAPINGFLYDTIGRNYRFGFRYRM